jgi:hypothetical protein
MDRNNNTKVFRNTLQKVTGHPEVVSHVDTFTRTNLILKLTWGDFSIDTRDINTSIQTSTVMSLNDIATKNLSCTYTTIIFALLNCFIKKNTPLNTNPAF